MPTNVFLRGISLPLFFKEEEEAPPIEILRFDGTEDTLMGECSVCGGQWYETDSEYGCWICPICGAEFEDVCHFQKHVPSIPERNVFIGKSQRQAAVEGDSLCGVEYQCRYSEDFKSRRNYPVMWFKINTEGFCLDRPNKKDIVTCDGDDAFLIKAFFHHIPREILKKTFGVKNIEELMDVIYNS